MYWFFSLLWSLGDGNFGGGGFTTFGDGEFQGGSYADPILVDDGG